MGRLLGHRIFAVPSFHLQASYCPLRYNQGRQRRFSKPKYQDFEHLPSVGIFQNSQVSGDTTCRYCGMRLAIGNVPKNITAASSCVILTSNQTGVVVTYSQTRPRNESEIVVRCGLRHS